MQRLLNEIAARAAEKRGGRAWETCFVTNGRIGLDVCISTGGDSVTFLNFEAGTALTATHAYLLRSRAEFDAQGGADVTGRDYGVHFRAGADARVLLTQQRKFGPEGSLTAKLRLTPDETEAQFVRAAGSGCVCALRAEGAVNYGYTNPTYGFSAEDSFALAEFGAAADAHAACLCGGCGTEADTLRQVSWCIGIGGDEGGAAAVGGEIIRIGALRTELTERGVRFTDAENRFDMTFIPLLQRSRKAAHRRADGGVCRIYGCFSGSIGTNGGETVEIRGLCGFADEVAN